MIKKERAQKSELRREWKRTGVVHKKEENWQKNRKTEKNTNRRKKNRKEKEQKENSGNKKWQDKKERTRVL